MKKNLECLTNLIGLSLKERPCAPDQPTDWEECNQSISGYYLDNQDFTAHIPDNTINTCVGDIWALMKEARASALIDLKAHFLQVVGDRFKTYNGNTKGRIGEVKGTEYNANILTGQNVGVQLTPQHCKGTVMKIKGIYLTIDTPGDYEIFITCIETGDTTSLGIINVTVANMMASIQANFSELLSDNKIFKIWYDTKGAKPIKYQIKCGTCTGSTPDYWSSMHVHGIQMNQSLMTVAKDTCTNGLIIDFCLQCDFCSWMCGVDDSFWCVDPFGTLFAKIFQMYASMKFNTLAIKHDKLGPALMLKKEEVLNLNKSTSSSINGLMYSLIERMPSGVSDCFRCKTKFNAQVKSNIVT